MERVGNIVRRVLRAIPGVQRDPQAVIGTCYFCENPVCHADGDRDAEGHPRHDSCEKLARGIEMSAVEHTKLFFQAVAIMRDLSGLKGRTEHIIQALPDDFDGRHALGAVTRFETLVKDEPCLVEASRQSALEALRSIRRSFFKLASAV